MNLKCRSLLEINNLYVKYNVLSDIENACRFILDNNSTAPDSFSLYIQYVMHIPGVENKIMSCKKESSMFQIDDLLSKDKISVFLDLIASEKELLLKKIKKMSEEGLVI